MLTRQKNLKVCVLLVGTSLIALVNVGHAAKSTSKGAARKSPVKVKTPTDAMRTNGHKPKIVLRPRAEVYSSGNANAKGSPAAAPKPAPLAGNAAVTRNVRGSGINTSLVKSHVDGQLSAVSHDKFSTIGERIQNGQLASQIQGANSAVLAGLNKVMPGFQNRGQGAFSLKDWGTTGGNSHNPVGSTMDLFTGGGAGKYSDDAGATFKQFKDGSSVVKVSGGDGKPPVITTTIPGTGSLVVNSDNSRTYTLDNGTTITYDSEGNRTSDITMGAATVTPAKGGKQGSKKEPTPDDGASDSSPKHITAATLRGLAARFSANRTSTGEEGTSGGTIDKSKTREGRLGQVGQPVDETGGSTGVAIDNMQIRQIARFRMRLIEPIQD